MTGLRLVEAYDGDGLETIRSLFAEYADSLGVDLGFQGFETELATLPGRYARPTGRLLLATWDDRPAGCGGLRALATPGDCELKRLYVRPDARGRGVGRALTEELVAAARAHGYSRMVLDTLARQMPEAVALYRRLGFVPTAAYTRNPVVGAEFMELALTEPTGNRPPAAGGPE